MPTASFWNPNNIEMPENPGEFNMTPPNAQDYMTSEEYAAYEKAMEEWRMSGYQPDLYPEYEDYMTPEKYAEYKAYYDEYQAAAAVYDEAINAYLSTRAQIYDESTPFLQNGFAMNADGTKFVAASMHEEIDEMSWWPVSVYQTYIFDINAGTFSKIESQYTDIVPNQILANGIIIGSTPANAMSGMPTLSYVYVPGSSDYVALENYLETSNAEAYNWMKENLVAEIPVAYDPETFEEIYEDILVSGHVSVSDDLSVMVGGVFAYMLPDEELADSGFITYVFENLEGSGVKTVAADNSLVKAIRGGVLVVSNEVRDLQVSDLSGRILFNAAKAQGAVNTNVNDGFYVVTYIDMEGNKISKKVSF